MRIGPLLFRITGLVLTIQLLLGGLLTFDFISAGPHIIFGFVVFILAIASMVGAFVIKPAFRPLRMMSLAMVALMLVQIVLGFVTLGTGSQPFAFLHFVNALAIYGMSVAGTFMAMRWDQMATMAPAG